MSEQISTVAGVELVWASATDPGQVRSVNEDSVLGSAPIFVVADGMGGHEAGDRASAAVIGAFARQVDASGPATIEMIRQALQDADDAVKVVGEGTRRGAGSTVTGAAVVEHRGAPHWLVFNVGDSRVYRHTGGTLEQITVDHSLMQEMIDAHELDPRDAADFPDGNVITRAMGTDDATADSWLIPLICGDRLLMCSDGLYRELADESIRAALTLAGPPGSAVDTLVRLANQSGGHDNVTALVVDVRTGGLAAGADIENTNSVRPLWAMTDDDESTLEVRR